MEFRDHYWALCRALFHLNNIHFLTSPFHTFSFILFFPTFLVSQFISYSQGFLPKATSQSAKGKIYKRMVKPAAVFWNETWAVTEVDMKRLGEWERKIYGPVVKQGMWEIETDQELRELYTDLDITSDTRKNRLEWVGHVVRLDQVRRVKKIIESEPEGSRRRGRPG